MVVGLPPAVPGGGAISRAIKEVLLSWSYHLDGVVVSHSAIKPHQNNEDSVTLFCGTYTENFYQVKYYDQWIQNQDRVENAFQISVDFFSSWHCSSTPHYSLILLHNPTHPKHLELLLLSP